MFNIDCLLKTYKEQTSAAVYFVLPEKLQLQTSVTSILKKKLNDMHWGVNNDAQTIYQLYIIISLMTF